MLERKPPDAPTSADDPRSSVPNDHAGLESHPDDAEHVDPDNVDPVHVDPADDVGAADDVDADDVDPDDVDPDDVEEAASADENSSRGDRGAPNNEAGSTPAGGVAEAPIRHRRLSGPAPGVSSKGQGDRWPFQPPGSPESDAPDPAVLPSGSKAAEGAAPAGMERREDGPPPVAPPFAGFVAHYGPALTGAPVSPLVAVGGKHRQYFEHVALEAGADGRVGLVSIGSQAYRASRSRDAGKDGTPPGKRPPLTEVTAELARHPERHYPSRTLSRIRFLVVHHTGASPDVALGDIAREHVTVNDWPGIAYHFVIGGDGAIAQTQDLTTVSHHARQFNPVSVGIAVAGDLTSDVPSADQMEALADVVAWLLLDLGLPLGALRGHREMVPTPCPGDAYESLWKPRLQRLVGVRLTAALEREAEAADA